MDLPTSLRYVALTALLAVVNVAIKRLWFGPLRGIPGSSLAAITDWYKIYWDWWRGGEMVEELERLHAKYGPVVRIGPNELHFSDPKAYTTIYMSGFPKEPEFYRAFDEHESSFGSSDVAFAKKRKDLISPLFSRRAILQLENTVQGKVDKMIHTLINRDTSKPVDMTSAVHSTTLDIIADYCFGESFNTLSTPEFNDPLLVALQASLPMFWTARYFPLTMKLLTSLPQRVLEFLSPEAAGLNTLVNTLFRQINHYLDSPDSLVNQEHETVYNHLLTLNHAKGHDVIPSRKSLFEEAVALTAAGSDTVGAACSLGTFYVLNDESLRQRLVEELVGAWPEMETPFGYVSLEQLPYLTAVIKESLRLSHGVITPAPRVVNQPTRIAGINVPERTIVSMGASFMHYNEDIFPEPRLFKPERWLDGKSKDLDAHLVAFSKGPRSCLGVNLAYCELYLLFGNIFRKLDMQIHDTTVDNFATCKACFMPVYPRHFKAMVSGKKALIDTA